MALSVHRDPTTVAGAAAARALSELTREERLHRLAGASFGRVAVAGSGVAPVIRPVNYRFDERSRSVVFRTRDGSKPAALLSAAEAAFEIDEIDSPPQHGWSVVVTGVTEQITDAGELMRLSTIGELPWADGCAGPLIRIRARSVSGRSIRSDQAQG